MAKSQHLHPGASSEKKKSKQAKDKKKMKRKKTGNEGSEMCVPAGVTEIKKKKTDTNDVTAIEDKKEEKQTETQNKINKFLEAFVLKTQSSPELIPPAVDDQLAEAELDDLSPEERRVLERKMKKIRRKEEKKRQREKEKDAKEENKSSVAQSQALEYLKCWSEKREEWKFQKTRQVWLLQHMYDSEKVSDAHFTMLLSYLEGLQGVARETTVQKAEALVRWGGQEGAAENKAYRAKEVIQILS